MAYGDPIILPLQIAYERGWVANLATDWYTAMDAANKYLGNTQEAMARIASLQSQGFSTQQITAEFQARTAERNSADMKNMIASGMSWADSLDVISGKWQLMDTNMGRVLVQTKSLQQELPRFLMDADGNLKQAGEGFQSAFRSGMQFFGLTILGFGLLSFTRELEASLGEKLPNSVTTLLDAFRTFAATAGAFAMMGMPEIGIIVGAAEAAIPLFLQLSPEIQDTNKALDQLAKKDEVVHTLSQILQVSDDVGKSLEKIARASPGAATALRDAFGQARPMGFPEEFVRMGLAGWQGIPGTSFGGMSGAIGTTPFGAIGSFLSGAGGALSQAITAPFDRLRMAQEALSLQNFIGTAQPELDTKRGADMSKAQEDFATKSNQWMTERARAWRDYQQELARIDVNGANEQIRIHQETRNRLTELDYKFGIDGHRTWREYYDKVADLEFQHGQQLERFNEEKRKRDQRYAHDRAKIDKDMFDQLADLAFNTEMELRKAHTEHDVEDIELRYAYNKAKIMREADDKKNDLAFRQQQDKLASDFQKKLDQEDYDHKRALAVRERDQKLGDLIEQYLHERGLVQQNESAQIEAARARTKEEKERATDRYNHEKERAEDAYKAIAKSYKDAKDKITEKYAEEQKALDELKITLDDLIAKVKNPQTMDLKIRITSEWDAAVTSASETMNSWASSIFGWLNEQGEKIFGGGIMGHQPGGVIPGARGSPRWIMAHGQERVVRPDQMENTSAAAEGNQIISISTEPILKPLMSGLIQQLTMHRAFREGVRAVVVDSGFVQ